VSANNTGQTTVSCFKLSISEEKVMKRMLLALGAISTTVVAGCASTQITQAAQVGSEEICIVDNPNDRQAFRDAYERTIRAKGYKPRVVNDAKACQVITTYSSRLNNRGQTTVFRNEHIES
jgi:hypothetical protein